MAIRTIENILEIYQFEDILEMNGLQPVDVLYLLHEYGEITLPEIKAVDLE
jgi:hypothetical protein